MADVLNLLLHKAPQFNLSLIYTFSKGPSVEKSFTVSGFNLTNNISVVAPTNYEISTSTGSQFAPTNPIVLVATSGAVNKTVIYARLKANLAVNSYKEKITLNSNQASEKSVALVGRVDTVATALSSFSENQLVVVPQDGGINILNIEAEKKIEVFNGIGQKIKSVQSKSGDNFIPISRGIYILKVGEKTKKIII